MGLSKTIWTNPTEFLKHQQPENPVLFFAPSAVQAVARVALERDHLFGDEPPCALAQGCNVRWDVEVHGRVFSNR